MTTRSFANRAAALLAAAGYAVVGQASDGAAGLAEMRRLKPDVVLLDIQLPDLDGFAVAAEMAAVPGSPLVVLISSRQASDYGSRLAAAEAEGFIHKPDLSRASLEALVGAPG